MLITNVFNKTGTTLIESENNVNITNNIVEQNVFLSKPTLIMYSPSNGCFYALKMPDDYDASDQFVGVFSG